MGKLIVVPPSMSIFYASGACSDVTKSVYSINPPYDNGNNIVGYVQVREPVQSVFVANNLADMFDLNFPSSQMIGRNEIKTYHLDQVQAAVIGKAFWDFEDLEKFVTEKLNDTIYLQKNGETWNFWGTTKDQLILADQIRRGKGNRFIVQRKYEHKLREWLTHNATVFDVYHYANAGSDMEVFIADDKEAVHCKMRWVGVIDELEEDFEEA